MGVIQLASQSDADWIRQFDPKKRVLTGRAYRVAKRAMDLVLVVLSLPVWLLFLGVIAFSIWISAPGKPVLFYHLRTGRNGKRFTMYKFRTMVPNAEELKAKYAHLNELKWPDFKITNDPRVTPMGRLLRKTSMDELPQLINVLRGDMSLVGPRPTFFSSENYKLWQTGRLDMLPGITGLWQIFGRGSVDFDTRSRLDIAYVERASLWLDINILCMTIPAVIQRRGVH
jgi:lipopolysaccharide/colanic/teichoic acid biosynthesis glycosyltransferase